MERQHQYFFAPPSSKNFDRVVNWCERKVKNFYELSSTANTPRCTPTQLMPMRAGPYSGNAYSGVFTNAPRTNFSNANYDISKFNTALVVNTVSGN
jgi:hypothetical protein